MLNRRGLIGASLAGPALVGVRGPPPPSLPGAGRGSS
jgi:hypothetical protein